MAPAMALAEADGLLRGLLVAFERRGLSSNPVSFVLGSPQRPYGKPRVSLPRRSYTNVSSRNESANLKWWRSEMETPPAGACGNVERGVVGRNVVGGGPSSLVCTVVMGRGPSAARLRSVASSCRAYTSRSGRAQSRRLVRVAGTAGRAHSRVVARVAGTVVAPRGEKSGGSVIRSVQPLSSGPCASIFENVTIFACGDGKMGNTFKAKSRKVLMDPHRHLRPLPSTTHSWLPEHIRLRLSVVYV